MATFKRRLVREKVLQALYAYEMSKEPITDVIENIFGEIKKSHDDFDFAKRLINEVVRHNDEIEKIIINKVAHWEFDRIAYIDKILLRMGICELLYFPEIPPKVTINESIEIAKNFSTDQSGKFINGILDALLEDFKKSKILVKKGRGLIDDSNPVEISHQQKIPPKEKQ
ncbi:MAG: transcription antitermination factor NusB [Ignavibacteriales bacterium]|nr:transcription antitermination factor NusB [Ignavibacteriales bacterium]